ncbi:MAG: response regulator transcription factor [Clostridia bacterium]|nr:response regulator transcription factor [Clostridia bacterium]
MAGETVLVVDDEKEIADLIEIYLSNEGYRVLKAYSGIEGLSIVEKESLQLVILDIMMPGMDGLELCRRIRREWNIPILMLSAKSQDIDKIMGLSTGADDYLTKPFNPLELIARVKSQLRRFLQLNPQNNPAAEGYESSITVNGLCINTRNHSVSVYGNEISLTPTEFGILHLLASNRGRVFSSEEIFERVWKERYFESDNTVMVHIRKIREKTEENPRKPVFIKTVWGVGYKIEN